MYSVLPIMRSHYSLGRSILTSDKPKGKISDSSPVSIFDIALAHNLKEIILVDNSISGFLEAEQNSKANKIKLIYGVLISCMENVSIKNELSLKTLSKIIVFIKNTNGYKDLIKITSFANKEGFYYKPNIDWANLKRLWTNNLLLAIPFYDSFLFNNSLKNYSCVPNFPNTIPTFFVENSYLPFDEFIQKKVINYTKSMGFPIIPSRSIYYYKNQDVLAYLTRRCIDNRSTLSKPEIEHCSSDYFSFERWQEQNSNPESVWL